MSRWVRLAAVVAAGLMLCSCASQPEIPFDKSEAQNIKTIAIVTPAMPRTPTVWLASDVGQSFGLVGALVDAGMQSNRDGDFWKAIDGDHNPPRAAFDAALAASLAQRGYVVRSITVTRPDGKFLKKYPTGDGADAYLDVTFVGNGYGYVAAGIGSSTPYRPYVYVSCRLVRASDGKTLMQDMVFDNPIGQAQKTVVVAPNPDYAYTDFDSLNGDPKGALAGMDDAFRKTTDAIGDLLH